jgi:soluble lytic murein transglycosylase-like protein
MAVQVPDWAVPYIRRASAGTGIPYSVCAAQAYVESGFQANVVSSAGAEGFWQFLPSTFASYARGSPFNVGDATTAYINFMNALLRQFGGNLRNALAAYNAGPGNYRAGLGYADTILRLAGSGTGVVAGGPPSTVSAPDTTITNVQADDWSWYIIQTAKHMESLSGTAQFWANYIGRL